jgi:hypothetical protein
MTKKEKEQKRVQAIEYLKEYFKPGDTVYTALLSVSSSGMSRHIAVYALGIRENGKPFIYQVSHLVADSLGYRRAKDGSLVVGGAGMDMGYSVAYGLSSVLFRDNFTCIGEGCPANDHTNGDPEGYKVGHKHTDGGYALRHSWI